MRAYSNSIKELRANEVFVFGTNSQGFHSDSDAGYASFGVYGNVWQSQGYGEANIGSLQKWTVKGKLGLQEGLVGKSYALPTTIRPGEKRSLPPDFKPLFDCCNTYPDWKFYLAYKDSKNNPDGWSTFELTQFMKSAGLIPKNLIVHSSLLKYFRPNAKYHGPGMYGRIQWQQFHPSPFGIGCNQPRQVDWSNQTTKRYTWSSNAFVPQWELR